MLYATLSRARCLILVGSVLRVLVLQVSSMVGYRGSEMAAHTIRDLEISGALVFCRLCVRCAAQDLEQQPAHARVQGITSKDGL